MTAGPDPGFHDPDAGRDAAPGAPPGGSAIPLSTDLLTGLFFIGLGGFAMIYGSRYALGTAARMGAGYFPLLISAGLLLVGALLVGRSFFVRGEALGSIGWRALVLVLAGTLAFGYFIDRAGLLVSCVLLVVAARLAGREFRVLEVAILAIGLALLTGAIFLYGLGLPIKFIRI